MSSEEQHELAPEPEPPLSKPPPAGLLNPWSTPMLETAMEELDIGDEGFFPSIAPALLDEDDLAKEVEYERVLR